MVTLNWSKIRNEYINGYISQRKLAEKHDIPYQTLRDRAQKELWADKRKVQREKISEKTAQKTAEKLAEKESSLAADIHSAAEELLAKIREATKQLDMCLMKEKRKYTRQVKDPDTGKVVYVDIEEEKPKTEKANFINKGELKQLASALKDIQSIQAFGKEGAPIDAPTINITVTAATPDDMESDDE